MGRNNQCNHFILNDRPPSSGNSALVPGPRCLLIYPVTLGHLSQPLLRGAFPGSSPHFCEEQNSSPFLIHSRNDLPSAVFTLCSQDPPSQDPQDPVQTTLHTRVHSSTAHNATGWKQPKWPSADEWINNMWYTHTVGMLFSPQKGKRFWYMLLHG